MTIQHSWIRVGGLGARHNSEVQGQCDLHPVPIRRKSYSGNLCERFLSVFQIPSLSITEQVHYWALCNILESPLFPPSFSLCGSKTATLIKAQCVTDTTPTRAWGPTDKRKRQSSQFCRGYRASQPCCVGCFLNMENQVTKEQRQTSCDSSSRDSADRNLVWRLLPNPNVGTGKPLSLWANKGRRAGKDGS